MLINPPIPGIQIFQNLMFKIQGQSHGWGQSWKSQHGSKIQSIHIPFVPCKLGIPFLSYHFFKIWPWKSKVKVMGEVTVQSHNVGLTSYWRTSLSFHVNFPPPPPPPPFLRYSIFQIWPWKSRVKVIWPWFSTTKGLDSSIELQIL